MRGGVLQNRVFAWMFLITAIILEVAGVSMLKAIDDPIVSKIVMLVFINISYVFMALALLNIALGVAYSVWEIVGLVGILLINFIFFKPDLEMYQYIGIGIGFVGIICVILGEKHEKDSLDSVDSHASHLDSHKGREQSAHHTATTH
ncbi:DMT family transporter [uncultured Helicobacter sp.]|uniref:DMT family transporter n=1 Tax=uncultured Helicobacter sp. TaxID=175537 RepID=UPI00374E558A